MNEDAFFEQAIREVQERRCVEALWARAIADGDGDKAKTISRYVRLRVEQLKYEARRSAPQSAPPSPSPQQGPGNAAAEPQRASASVWRRFFARTLDILWEAPLVGAIVGYLGSVNTDLGDLIATSNPSVLGVLVAPIVMLFDAAVVAMFFNSPGKALLGLKVVSAEAESLSPAEYLERNMRLWVSGMAFGLPLLSLFAAAYQGERAWRDGYTTYDRARGTLVLAGRLGFVQVAAAIFVLIALLSLNAVIAAAFSQ
jgi:uncharacterized RDD family membrane protein YckC